jgi:hypothetical protein
MMKICNYCKKPIEENEYNVIITTNNKSICHHQTDQEVTFGYDPKTNRVKNPLGNKPCS